MKWPEIYRFQFAGLPVTIHINPSKRFKWTHIYGIGIGPWFIGAIRGSEEA